ncbi:MAG: hypothetical protein O2867_03065 [Bacteroidetes bacterium]|nr:hypothetical protein [Bacteroidota bacterium]MDA0972694.1 hypothetical protein [Bacteroidota bacterium]
MKPLRFTAPLIILVMLMGACASQKRSTYPKRKVNKKKCNCPKWTHIPADSYDYQAGPC